MKDFKDPEMKVEKLTNEAIEAVTGGTNGDIREADEEAARLCFGVEKAELDGLCSAPVVGVKTSKAELDGLCSAPVVGVRTSKEADGTRMCSAPAINIFGK